jgi:integrase
MRVELTKELLKDLPAGPADLYDTKLPGLLLRVHRSGRANWYVQFGRAKKISIGRADVVTPAGARVLAKGLLGDVARGQDPRADRRQQRGGDTFRTFLTTTYQPWLEAQPHHKSSKATMRRLLTIFPSTILDRPLTEISSFAVEAWRTSRRTAGRTEATINRDLNDLRAALSRAVDWGRLTQHPLRAVKATRLDTIGKLRYLSADEEARLRSFLLARDEARREKRRRFSAWRVERGRPALPDYPVYPDHLHPLILLALQTGLRRGELLALRWAEIDLVHARLTVRGTTAKSGRTRHLPLNVDAVQVLRDWRAGRTVDQRAATSVVFAGEDGEPMFSLKTSWLKVARAAKLTDVRFHDLRHTFASKLVQAGVDLNTVRALLGHADLKMTLRYAHLAPENLSAAVAKLVASS